MHELGIAGEIHRQCRAVLAAAGAVRLERVRVRIGELSAVEPDLLRFAWEAVIAGGADDGAALDIEWCAARQRCGACGCDAPRGPGEWIERCLTCGGALGVDGGQELDLVELAYGPAVRPAEVVR